MNEFVCVLNAIFQCASITLKKMHSRKSNNKSNQKKQHNGKYEEEEEEVEKTKKRCVEKKYN